MRKRPQARQLCFPMPSIPRSMLQLRSALLSWYDANHRILPWRRNAHSQLPPAAVEAAAAEDRLPAPLDLPADQFAYWVWVCEVRRRRATWCWVQLLIFDLSSARAQTQPSALIPATCHPSQPSGSDFMEPPPHPPNHARIPRRSCASRPRCPGPQNISGAG